MRVQWLSWGQPSPMPGWVISQTHPGGCNGPGSSSSTACQHCSCGHHGYHAASSSPHVARSWQVLTAIKDSRRHFIDEWVVDACLLVSCGKLLWCRILYSSQSSSEKVSSLSFRSVLQSICYVSCRIQLISLEGGDSYIGFTHDSSRQREHWGAGLILSCAPADIKELYI